MKNKSQVLIGVLFTTLFTCWTSADSLKARPELTPKLVGADTIWVDVGMADNENSNLIDLEQIQKKCSGKLQKAGIKVTEDPDLRTWSNKSKIPVLKIRINVFEMNDSSNFIFHIKTSFSRLVTLTINKEEILYKADVWESKSVMDCTLKQQLSENLNNAIMNQVDSFITEWSASNISEGTNTSVNKKEQLSGKSGRQVEQKFVASKNGKVFHKPDCRSAARISAGNLVSYNSKEEAIAAGKRPCKQCNP
jgi:hypothetical protein